MLWVQSYGSLWPGRPHQDTPNSAWNNDMTSPQLVIPSISDSSLQVSSMYKGNPSSKDTIGTLLSVRDREVSLIRELLCTCSYSWDYMYRGVLYNRGVLYSGVSFIQGCPLTGVPRYCIRLIFVGTLFAKPGKWWVYEIITMTMRSSFPDCTYSYNTLYYAWKF